MKFKEKMASRKFLLTILIIVLSTSLLTIPAIIGLFISKTFVLLNGTQWTATISAIIASYIAGNVYQNRAEINASYIEDTHVRTIVHEKSDVTSDEEFENREEAEV